MSSAYFTLLSVIYSVSHPAFLNSRSASAKECLYSHVRQREEREGDRGEREREKREEINKKWRGISDVMLKMSQQTERREGQEQKRLKGGRDGWKVEGKGRSVAEGTSYRVTSGNSLAIASTSPLCFFTKSFNKSHSSEVNSLQRISRKVCK